MVDALALHVFFHALFFFFNSQLYLVSPMLDRRSTVLESFCFGCGAFVPTTRGISPLPFFSVKRKKLIAGCSWIRVVVLAMIQRLLPRNGSRRGETSIQILGCFPRGLSAGRKRFGGVAVSVSFFIYLIC